MERSELSFSPELFSEPQQTAAWFAGALEIGATTGIGVSQHTDKYGHTYRKALPYIEIRSTFPPMLDKLYRVYGGMLKPKFWSKSGRDAAQIVADTLPYTVARQEHALAMVNWLDAENMEEKIDIAHELESRNWQGKGNQDAYRNLLENPAFVAGILDSRASMYQKKALYHHTLGIQTPSKNLALLNALQAKFGGSVRITNKAGTEIDHGDVYFETKVDSYVWDIAGKKAIALVKSVENKLQTPPPEDWLFERDLERQSEGEVEHQVLTDRITTRIRRELILLKAGRRPRLTTDLGLRRRYGIHQRTLVKCLSSLTADEYSARRAAVRHYAKSNVDAVKAHEIIKAIREEIDQYCQGVIDRISYREELAERFGIGLKTLTGGVLPLLDEDVRQARLEIVQSQGTRERNLRYWPKWREENQRR